MNSLPPPPPRLLPDGANSFRVGLYALGRWQNGATQIAFRDASPVLTELLRDFGPQRKSYHPEFPFWHLQSDGVWRRLTSNGIRQLARTLRKTGSRNVRFTTGYLILACSRCLLIES